MPWEPHDIFKAPEDDAVLWKFSDLAKFSHMLTHSRLFFCRLDHFRDPWEGHLPRKFYDLAPEEWLRQVGQENPTETATQSIRNFYEWIHNQRTHYAAYCLHKGTKDVEAMWRLYSDMEYGVAFKTTMNAFREAVSRERRSVFVGQVEYLDFEREIFTLDNVLRMAVMKRMQFKYENEVRAIVWENAAMPDAEDRVPFDTPSGCHIQVDLSKLIQEVVVSPLCPDWVASTLVKMLEVHGVNAPVSQSTLFLPPPTPRALS